MKVFEESNHVLRTEKKTISTPVDTVVDGFVKREYVDTLVDAAILENGQLTYDTTPIKVIRHEWPGGLIDTYYEHEKALLLKEVGKPAGPYIIEAGWQ